MRLLTRPEELILLAIWRLQKEAYCVPIRKQLIDVTGKDWSFGAIYDPLDRLEKKGLLESYLSDPVQERGGRSKRIYKHTKEGLEALLEIKKVQEAMWNGISSIAMENEL